MEERVNRELRQLRARVSRYRAVQARLKDNDSQFNGAASTSFEVIASNNSENNGHPVSATIADKQATEDDDTELEQEAIDGRVEEGGKTSEEEERQISEEEDEEKSGEDERETSEEEQQEVCREERGLFEEANQDDDREINEIREWAIESEIPQTHLDKLLAILRRRLLPGLAKSSKTFLSTVSAMYNIRPMGTSIDGTMGEFVYFGIERGIQKCIDSNIHKSEVILLQINVDGVPLFNSGSMQFWPILVKIFWRPDIYTPFPAALYCGKAKPASVQEFCAEFIEELNRILNDGIYINGKRFTVKIQCFICDTPARAFLKNCKGHGGYYACERCETKGQYVDRRVVYPEMDCPERTQASFANFKQPEHHVGISPLTAILPEVDLVSKFILDYMHLCFLGVTKKLLSQYWFGQKSRQRIRPRVQKEISKRLLSISHCIPMDFQRKIENVIHVARWKSTHFRFFLLYCGSIVLKGMLNRNLYKHFLLLHVSVRILCDHELAFEHNNLAKLYLRTFFKHMVTFYGEKSQIINIHNVIHLADDVMNTRCTLDEISAFPFENMLGKMKKKIRSPNRPLAQFCRRMHELRQTDTKPFVPPVVEILKYEDAGENLLSITKIRYKGYVLTTQLPNCMVILDDETVLLIDQMTCRKSSPNDIEIIGRPWERTGSIFNYPLDSADLGEWELSDKPHDIKRTCNIINIRCKMVHLCMNRTNAQCKNYAIAFLH